jgi:hypothetical protein
MKQAAELPYHEGHPKARNYENGVVVLCEFDHVLYTIPAWQYPGSHAEANLADPTYVERCHGTLSKERQAAKREGA